ncbi:MAG: hypothetical protein ABSD49_14400 [Candidatus Bathyarchaeia archaeon]|jgi:hypothetical protein
MDKKQVELWYNRGKNYGWNDAYREMRKFLTENPNATYEEIVAFCAGKMKAM